MRKHDRGRSDVVRDLKAEKNEMINVQVLKDGAIYTNEELRKAFDSIADADDWKNPIAAIMPGEYVSIAVASIVFYTATVPKISLDVKTMKYLVTSDGYRAGPAGDH